MLVVDNSDAIRGIAEVATKLDFIVNGYVGTTATQLADGQLGTGEADLYLSGADGVVVTSITIVNTDSAARTFTLYLKPSGGTSRAITPVSLDLGIGHSLYTDGQRIVVTDKNGNTLSTTTVLAHSLGGSSHDADTLSNLNGKISDATLVDASAISSEIDGDISTHASLATVHQDAPALIGTHASDIDAHISGASAGELLVATGATTAVLKNTGVKLTAPDISGVVTAAAALTMPAFAISGEDALTLDSIVPRIRFYESDQGANLKYLYMSMAGGTLYWQRYDDDGSGDATVLMTLSRATGILAPLGLGATTLRGTLTLNGQVLDAGAGDIRVNTTGSERGLLLVGSNAANGPNIIMRRTSAAGVGKILGIVQWDGKDGAGADGFRWGVIFVKPTNVGNGTEESMMEWLGVTAGAENTNMSLSGAGALWLDSRINVNGTVTGYYRNRISGNFVSDGTSTILHGLQVDGTLTGFSGDTARLIGTQFANNIVTQSVAETIGIIAQVQINEPLITKNVTTITVAATLYISGAPNEGAENAAIWINSGDINIESGILSMAGTQVVSTQGAAVADATDAASVILRLNELLARVRTHGLIAT